MERNRFGNTKASMDAILEDYTGVRPTPNFCLVSWWKKQAADFLAGRKHCFLQWFQWLLVPLCCSHLICPFLLAALSTGLSMCLQMGTLVQTCCPVVMEEASPCLTSLHLLALNRIILCIQWILPCSCWSCKIKMYRKNAAFCHEGND